MSYQDEMYSGMVEWRLAARQTRLGDAIRRLRDMVLSTSAQKFDLHAKDEHTMSVHCDNLFNLVYRDNLSVIKDFLPQPARGVRLNYDLVF